MSRPAHSQFEITSPRQPDSSVTLYLLIAFYFENTRCLRQIRISASRHHSLLLTRFFRGPLASSSLARDLSRFFTCFGSSVKSVIEHRRHACSDDSAPSGSFNVATSGDSLLAMLPLALGASALAHFDRAFRVAITAADDFFRTCRPGLCWLHKLIGHR